MPTFNELSELARQSYALAAGTLEPQTKQHLLDIGAKYTRQAEELRRNAVIRAEYPKDNKIE